MERLWNPSPHWTKEDEIGSHPGSQGAGQLPRTALTDGRVIERDLGPMLEGPVFSEIRNDEMRFMEFRVEGGTLVWPAGADAANICG